MKPGEILPGDILQWRNAPTQRYRLESVVDGRENRIPYSVMRLERTDGTHLEYHLPTRVDMPDPDNGGPDVFASDGCRCEACETFLHEDDKGSTDPVSGGIFCHDCCCYR